MAETRPASAPDEAGTSWPSTAAPATPLILVRYRSESDDDDGDRATRAGDAAPSSFFSWRALAAHVGPGLLVATAYLDPGNLEACVTAGSASGYALLWVLALATAAGGAVQVLAVRLGVGGGADLARLAGAGYGRAASVFLWAATQLAITGADVQALAGSAVAVGQLTRGAVPPAAGVAAAAAASLAVLALATHARAGSVRALEGTFALLVGALGAAALTLAAVAPVDWAGVVRGLAVPSLPPGQLPAAAAVVGSVLMGHNLFLHSACVQSRQPVAARRRPGRGASAGAAAARGPRPADRPTRAQRAALAYFTIETCAALAGAGAICASVIAVFATSRGGAGAAAAAIGLDGAGAFLARTYSPALAAVWAVGVLAAGQSAAMAGAYAAQHVAAGFGRAVVSGGGPATGLLASPARLAGLARVAAVAPAVAIALSGGAGAGAGAAALDAATQGLNVVQALQLPFALVPLIRLAATPAAAGGLAAGVGVTAMCVAIAAAVLACNAGVAAGAAAAVSAAAGGGWGGKAAAALAALAYVAPLAWLATATLDEDAMRAARAAAAAEAREAVEAALCVCGGRIEEGGGGPAAPLLGGGEAGAAGAASGV